MNRKRLILGLVICAVVSAGNHMMLPRHFPRAYSTHPYGAALLSIAVAIAQVSIIYIGVLIIRALCCRPKQDARRNIWLLARMIAYGVDCGISFCAGAIIMTVARVVLSYSMSLILALLGMSAVLVLRDIMTSRGSIGKRVVGLSLERQQAAVRGEAVDRVIRNVLPALLCILTLLAAGAEFRGNGYILAAHLAVSVLFILDLWVLWRSGLRVEDAALGFRVSRGS